MAITVNYGAYVKGFPVYPIDTREMTNNTNTTLSTIMSTITANVPNPTVVDVQWTYFGGAGYVTVIYTTSGTPVSAVI